MGIKKLRIDIYTSADLRKLEDELFFNYPLAYQAFRAGREAGGKSAVAFTGDRVLMFIDDSLEGTERDWAVAHVMGHVVFRTMLEGEAKRSTPLWRRIYAQYPASGRTKSFMEWFADEVAKWSLEICTPEIIFSTQYGEKIIERFIQWKTAETETPTINMAIKAFLDALVLRQCNIIDREFIDNFNQKKRYDLLTFHITYKDMCLVNQSSFERSDVDF